MSAWMSGYPLKLLGTAPVTGLHPAFQCPQAATARVHVTAQGHLPALLLGGPQLAVGLVAIDLLVCLQATKTLKCR